jgi:phosphoribosyl-AMP cyclohydrolase
MDIPAVLDPAIAQRLKKNPDGLVAAIAQQHDTGEVLMLGWMDEEALRRTLTSGRATYYSRSRQEYWRKGDTSGHIQEVVSVALDCDGDALLVRVDQTGAACHTGTRTCFDGRLLPVTRPDNATGAAQSTTAEDTTPQDTTAIDTAAAQEASTDA